MSEFIANSIKKRGWKIGVLGLSYKGDLKVSVLSKVIPLVKSLIKKSHVRLYDPYFQKKYTMQLKLKLLISLGI